MPTKREREYYAAGYRDGRRAADLGRSQFAEIEDQYELSREILGLKGTGPVTFTTGPKRKLSAWNKFVKANSKKPRFRYRNGKLNLKKMAVAFRKTPAGRKKRR